MKIAKKGRQLHRQKLKELANRHGHTFTAAEIADLEGVFEGFQVDLIMLAPLRKPGAKQVMERFQLVVADFQALLSKHSVFSRLYELTDACAHKEALEQGEPVSFNKIQFLPSQSPTQAATWQIRLQALDTHCSMIFRHLPKGKGRPKEFEDRFLAVALARMFIRHELPVSASPTSMFCDTLHLLLARLHRSRTDIRYLARDALNIVKQASTPRSGGKK